MIKTRPKAIALALSGFLIPGLHKFYLQQRTWGIVYLLLYPTAIPQFASLLEGLWYACLSSKAFDQAFNPDLARLRTDPQTPLRSLDEVNLAASLNQTIDVNRATAADWQRLPGISAEQGRSLATLTQSGVQFNSLEDLAAALGVEPRQLQPLAPILRFYYYDSPPAMTDLLTPTQCVNPNHASLAELLSIPSMDSALATSIIQLRQTAPYRDLAEFQQRLSLSPEMTAHFMHYVRF